MKLHGNQTSNHVNQNDNQRNCKLCKKQDNEIETITITRKLNIIPIKSENNTCIKKVYKFHIDKINKKIETFWLNVNQRKRIKRKKKRLQI